MSIFDAFQLFLPQLIPKAAESLAMLCMMKLCTKSSHLRNGHHNPSVSQKLPSQSSYPGTSFGKHSDTNQILVVASDQLLNPLLRPPNKWGKGGNFQMLLPTSMLKVGSVLGQHWRAWQAFRVDGGGPLLRLFCFISPPPTCVFGASSSLLMAWGL